MGREQGLLDVECQGTGRNIALLHGWGLHRGVFSGISAGLAESLRVQLVDLPGHGRSADVAFDGLEDAADRVAARIESGTILCGWSLGGLVALRLALRHPEKVRAMVLVSATPCFVAREGWPHGMLETTLSGFADDLLRDAGGTIRTFLALNAMGAAVGRARGRAAIRELAATLAATGNPHPSALTEGLETLRAADLRGEAAMARQRTLVIHGTRDVVVPVEAARWLAATLPDARLLEMKDAGHAPFLTHPEPFVRAVRDFCA